jgi:hypothetical protein
MAPLVRGRCGAAGPVADELPKPAVSVTTSGLPLQHQPTTTITTYRATRRRNQAPFTPKRHDSPRDTTANVRNRAAPLNRPEEQRRTPSAFHPVQPRTMVYNFFQRLDNDWQRQMIRQQSN